MKNRFRFHLCLICMFVFAVAGCKVKRPSDVISESKMENLLYDYHVAKSMGDNLPYSENYKKALYINAVFKKYGTHKLHLTHPWFGIPVTQRFYRKFMIR